jgi:hypothetical protein
MRASKLFSVFEPLAEAFYHPGGADPADAARATI